MRVFDYETGKHIFATGASGVELIAAIMRYYDIILQVNDKHKNDNNFSDKRTELDTTKFLNLLAKIPTEYVCKKNYEILKKQKEELEQERKDSYQSYCRNSEDSYYKSEIERYKNEIYGLHREMDLRESKHQQEIDELEKKIQKWQAMYTGQAEANAILCRKIEKLEEA